MDINSIRKDFVRLFGSMATHRNRYEVFRDFVHMAGISLYNAIGQDAALEQEYMQIVGRYDRADQQRFPELLAMIVNALTIYPHDFMGATFMELELGNASAGQFFTPWEIQRLMAMLVVNERDDLEGKEFLMYQEPACGAGGMIIAFAEAMREKGLNPQKQLWFEAIDIDSVPTMMCYIQLSLLHIPGIVINGCALRGSVHRAYRTPAHMMGFWEAKVKRRMQEQRESQASDLHAQPPSPIIITPTPAPASGPWERPRVNEGQFSLFQLL